MAPPWPALAVLALCLAVPGCLEPCPYTMAGWTDRAVYDALYIHEMQWPPSEGWAIADQALDARWGSQRSLVWVESIPPGRPDHLRMGAGFLSGLHVTDSRPSILVAADGDGSGIEAEVDRFVGLLAPSPEAAAQVRADLERQRIVAQEACPERQPCRETKRSVQMDAALPAGWGAQRAWDALPGAAARAELPHPYVAEGRAPFPGEAVLGQAGWTFRFQLPVRSDSNGFEADPEGHVALHLWSGKQQDADAFREEVRGFVAGFGLPPPQGDFAVEREFCRY